MITKYQADRENSILFGRRNTEVHKNFYIALSSSTINENGTGLTEPTDRNYSRILIPNDEFNFTVSSNGIIKNITTWEFNISTKAWENPITHWAIMDSLKGGRILYYDELPSPMRVDVNQVVLFNPQTIQIKRSGI